MQQNTKPTTQKNQIKIHSYEISGTHLAELRQISNEVFHTHAYYVEGLGTNPTILDVGAHVGIATHYFKHTYPHSLVVAVEPHPTNFHFLEENISWNRLEGVSVFQAAVVPASKAHDTVTLYTDEKSEWLSTTGIHPSAWNGAQEGMAPITVPTATLQDLLDLLPNGTADLVKMDIEGSEWDVLMGATKELTHIKHLLVEYHPRKDQILPKLIQHLSQYGLDATEPIHKSRKKLNTLQILEFTQHV